MTGVGPKFVNMNVSLVDNMGSDVNIVNAARVSYAKEVEEFDEDKDAKLINYLAKHNHWSPFAHTSVSLRIKAPIFVARQMVKHRIGGDWNEESRRYISEEPEFYLPEVWRGKPKNSKQGSSEEDVSKKCALFEFSDKSPFEFQVGVDTTVEDTAAQLTDRALRDYEALLAAGVCPEQARMVLPQNTMTNWIWTGSVIFFARVCKLRMASDSQKESRDLASKINQIVAPLYPTSWKALMEHLKV